MLLPAHFERDMANFLDRQQDSDVESTFNDAKVPRDQVRAYARGNKVTILVCPLSGVLELVRARRPNRVVSLLDPEFEFPDLGAEYHDRHLRLHFHDAHDSSDGQIVPSPEHIEELLSFLAAWVHTTSLLVHCRAGIGRSTAAAYVACCWRNPGVSEHRIAEGLRSVAPLARPNETLVRLSDEALNREGRMSAAIADTGRGLPWIELDEGVPFELPSVFDDATSAV